MQFGLTEEQRMIVETTRSFVENELYPHEQEVERTGHLRMDLIRDLQARAMAAGLYAANMPAEVGGAGLDTLSWLLYELRRAALEHPFGRDRRAAAKIPLPLHPGREMGLPRHDGTRCRVRSARHEGQRTARWR